MSGDSLHLDLEPDTQDGAFQGCDCATCREARLNDDDRMVYSARDVAGAWVAGYTDALKRVLRD